MPRIFQKAGFVLLSGAMIAGVTSIAPANASSVNKEYVHSSCEGANAVCGVIIMGNAGSFSVDWVSVSARDSQPGGDATHPKCSEVNKKLDSDLLQNKYDRFIVPAACAYKLKLKIHSGNSKDQNLYLTPGCSIVTVVKGTSSSNSWKGNEVAALNEKVSTNSDGVPIDKNGHKCGKQSSAGF
ncbi:MAG: hypothetical protein ACE37M_00890 [Henriciella sp.]